MRWLKLYSITLLSLIVAIAVLSFFIMDLLPVLYKFYRGQEASLLNLVKLQTFGLELRAELRLYLILSFITFMLMSFVNTLKQYLILVMIFIFIHFVFIAEIGEFIIFRRLYQMLIMLPLLWIFFDFFKFRKERYEKKITHGFLYITLLCMVLPGLYLPPFFSGIPGWTTQIDKNETFIVEGVFLLRDDGKEIRFSRAIVSPINFVTRLNNYIVTRQPQSVSDLLKFYKTSYVKRYFILERGFMPSENFLGKLAYPIHNPYGNFDYSEFPPNRIKEIRLLRKHYSWNKKLVKEEIIAKEDWR